MKILKSNIKKSLGALTLAVGMMAIMPLSASAHCDTMEGPTVADGYKVIFEKLRFWIWMRFC